MKTLLKIASLFVALHFLWNSTKNEARANDSAFSGVSGTPKPMRGEHASVAMQSEQIVITADAKGTSTTVDFVFRNDGGKTSVQMGFPESSYGDVPAAKKSAFLRFATWVDGRKVPAKRVVTAMSEGSTNAYWLKTVDFGAKQTRRVRVSYRAPWGGNVEWGTRRALTYNFTGQNWKGKVERSDLEIRVASPGLWLGLPLFNYQSLPMSLQTTPKAAIFRKNWRNWQAQGTLTFGLTRTVPGWMLDRGALSASMVNPTHLRNAVAFRVGNVPDDLPDGAESPPAFIRKGATYISLAHLRSRLEGFRDEIGKVGKDAKLMRVDIEHEPFGRQYTLRADTFRLIYPLGSRQMRWASRSASFHVTLPTPPIMLRGQNQSTLYVPLKSAAETLGLSFKIDPKNRLFNLGRGNWPEKQYGVP